MQGRGEESNGGDLNCFQCQSVFAKGGGKRLSGKGRLRKNVGRGLETKDPSPRALPGPLPTCPAPTHRHLAAPLSRRFHGCGEPEGGNKAAGGGRQDKEAPKPRAPHARLPGESMGACAPLVPAPWLLGTRSKGKRRGSARLLPPRGARALRPLGTGEEPRRGSS